MDNEKFGKFIKELRNEKGLTQKELGEKLNITDKAISKWERGLSFPDIALLNSLACFFNVDISELLNGERGIKKEIDVDKLIKEAIEKYKNMEEMRKQKINKIKKIMGKVSLIILIIFILIQSAFLFILKKRGYEYVIDSMPYIINELIIISSFICIEFLVKQFKNKKVITYIICLILTIINIAFLCNNGIANKSIISFSKDFSNELVLKINRKSGSITLYRNAKFFIFARKSEQFSYELEGKIKKQWLTNDICALTYKDKDGMLREFVATYGDRGNGISYYYVSSALNGNWQVFTQYGSPTRLLADTKGITITKNGEKELFEYANCKQFGTIALVLYKNEIPEYVVALDKNCKIDEQTGIIKKGGTITLSEVSMDKTITESLYCMTFKNSEDLGNYNIVNVAKNEYTIQNGILYYSYDGVNTIEVPGDFSEMSSLKGSCYQISKEKTVFCYIKDDKRYLVYSNDMGNTWETVEIENKTSIQSIQFINSRIGYILKFTDVAMGTAVGKISKTENGGKNWIDIYGGIADEQRIFKTSSEMFFVNNEIGFITMPESGGEKQDLYISKDGGKSFNRLELIKSDIYDYYNLPTINGKYINVKVSQGTDGDYNGGDFKTYYSEDYGDKWNLVQ